MHRRISAFIALFTAAFAASLLVSGLFAGTAEADVGQYKWDLDDVGIDDLWVPIELAGNNWDNVGTGILGAVTGADTEWSSNTDWHPLVTVASHDNDVLWSEDSPDLSPWCVVPSEPTIAWACRTVTSGGYFYQIDIIFDGEADYDGWSWTSARTEGVAVHELGHFGGLDHSNDPNDDCDPLDVDRLTMCEWMSPSNASWASSLEGIDISEANIMYP